LEKHQQLGKNQLNIPSAPLLISIVY